MVLAALALAASTHAGAAEPEAAWSAWTASTLDKARRENRAILLYIRSFGCHRCEVADREVAGPVLATLHRDFVCVRVEPEAQPEVAGAYLAAASALAGPAAAPTVVFLLPDGRPIHAVALRSPARAGVAGEVQAAARRIAPESAEEAGRRGLELMRKAIVSDAPPRPPSAADVRRALDALTAVGPGPRPPFPPLRPAPELHALVRWSARPGRRDPVVPALDRRLEALARGALRDHVGGGFFAGASEAEPDVPRFEKRVGDNALLLRAFARGYALTGNLLYRDVAREIVSWAVREMRDSAGDFWSSIGASSEGADGRYYLWSRDEIAGALGADRAAEFGRTYELVPPGVLLLRGSPFAGVGASRQVLMSRRTRRVRPATDGRVVAGWNGLMIGAAAASGSLLRWSADLEVARRAADAVLRRLGQARALRHSSATAEGSAVLEDYALLAEGMLDLHEATGEPRWRREATSLVDAAVARFWDESRGGFFGADARNGPLPLRPREARDRDLPAANAVLADLLLRLASGGDRRYRLLGQRTVEAFAAEMEEDPRSMGTFAVAADEWLAGATPSPGSATPTPR